MRLDEAKQILNENGYLLEEWIENFNRDIKLVKVNQNRQLSTARMIVIDKITAPTKGLNANEEYHMMQKYKQYLIEKNYDTIMEDLHMFYISTGSGDTNVSVYLNDDGSWAKHIKKYDTSDIVE